MMQAHTSETLRDAFRYLYPDELPLLKSLPVMIDRSPCVVVNIGAGAGTSGLAFLETREDLILHTIDITAGDSPFGCLFAERQVCEAAGFASAYGVRWFQHHADSKALARDWQHGLVDLVFVDGAHEEEDCAGDILGWMPHIRSGGLLAVHDYKKGDVPVNPNGPHPLVWGGVDLAVDRLLVGKYDIIAHVDSLIVFKVSK